MIRIGNAQVWVHDQDEAHAFYTQQRGFEVRTVETAADMRRDLGREWALVCVDVELPDARGTRLVDEVVRSQEGRPAPAAVVALVRDKADMNAAAKAGEDGHKAGAKGQSGEGGDDFTGIGGVAGRAGQIPEQHRDREQGEAGDHAGGKQRPTKWRRIDHAIPGIGR